MLELEPLLPEEILLPLLLLLLVEELLFKSGVVELFEDIAVLLFGIDKLCPSRFKDGWKREEKLLGRRIPLLPIPCGDMRGKSSRMRAKERAEVTGKRKNCWRITTSSSLGGIVHFERRPPRGS